MDAKKKKIIIGVVAALVVVGIVVTCILVFGKGSDKKDDKNADVKAQPILEENEEIPDSLLHPRWKIQRTQPITDDDLSQGSADLQRPENMKQTVEYNDTIDRYIIGNKVAGTYVWAPTMMTYDEYFKWSEKKALYEFFRSKNEEAAKTNGKEKFDVTEKVVKK